jgi:hypothetical protein
LEKIGFVNIYILRAWGMGLGGWGDKGDKERSLSGGNLHTVRDLATDFSLRRGEGL